MPLGVFPRGFLMAKVQPEDQHFDLRVKSSVKEGQRLRVVEIRYVRTPDADERLSRAIDILLRSAARHATQAKEIQNTEKQESPRQAPAKDALTIDDESDP